MCGIFGYVGNKRNPINTALEGLKKLEYRGYDSVGVGIIEQRKTSHFKVVGKVPLLESQLAAKEINTNVVIAQTRWATHGKVSVENAHPHYDAKQTTLLVHNGIIENYEVLKKPLVDLGIPFVSDTDTEVVVQLIGATYNGDILKTVQDVVAQIKGSYAFVLIHQDFPDQIIAVANESPLVIGIGNDEAFIASDPHAFAFHTREVIHLSHAEIAVVKANSLEVYNAGGSVTKNSSLLNFHMEESSKGDFEHYTLKEIYEQPQCIRNALLGRIVPEYGTAIFDEMTLSSQQLLMAERILILGCGTSWHAGYAAAYMLEELARIPVEVDISSEFRYKNSIITPKTCVIAISQSGETADTISAVRELKARGVQIISLCNVQESTLARNSDSCLFLKAGPEIGVCSTKAFTSQVVVLSLFTLLMARMRYMDANKGQEFIEALIQLPEKVQLVLDSADQIRAVAKKYAKYEHFFFLGRNYMYPAALEGALKLKESSYINANAYPGGEIKHGPLALINPECPTVGLCCNERTREKIISNLMEVEARGGPVVAITQWPEDVIKKVDDVIVVPKICDPLAIIPTTVATQLLAYYIAKERGIDIDRPRNLAKAVTVE